MRGELFRYVGVALSLWAFSGCDLDGGGGGGGGDTVFTKGYVFVRSSDRNVYAADQSDFQSVLQLTQNGNNKHPSLSADGKLVAFIHTAGGQSEVQTVATLSGATPSTVVASDTTRGNFRNPVFSPDGTFLVFTYDDAGVSTLGRVDVSGANFQTVGQGCGALSCGAAAFFPDGQSLLVPAGSSAALLTKLLRVILSSGLSTVVRDSLGNEALQVANRAVVSPDGTQGAFDGRTSSGSLRIFVFDVADPVTVSQLTDHPGDVTANDTFPTWAGSTRVAFSSDTGGADQVYEAQADAATKSAGSLTVPSALEPWFGPN